MKNFLLLLFLVSSTLTYRKEIYFFNAINTFLNIYVESMRVDHKSIHLEPTDLNELIDRMAVSQWSEENKKAYL